MFFILFIVYVIGGVTFIPILFIAAAVYVFYYEESRPRQPLEPRDNATAQQSSSSSSTAGATLKTWLTARRTFEASPQTYMSMVRTLLDSRSANPRRAEDAYLAVLKGNVLYLYEDHAMRDCAAAIDIMQCRVNVYPEAGLLDGELFTKRNALLIRKVHDDDEWKETEGEKEKGSMSLAEPWYVFFKSVSVMEDWYLGLLAVQHETPPPYPLAAHASLLSSLDSLPDFIPTRWLNALLGRLFLAVKGTTAVEAWVIARLMKKLSKVKKPGFLKNVVVRSFEAGDLAPVLSKPMLKELTPDGEASVGVDVSYTPPPGGEMRITVSAIATISLPSTSFSLFGKNKEKNAAQDKPYEVSLVLVVVVKKVVGNILVKIKRPPSNRLWYAFTTMPQMEISIEPVVSDRQIRWGMVLSVIENKLKEIIQDSVVLPYMDDVPFFDTSAYPIRGGIFHEAFLRPSTTSTTTTTTFTIADKTTTIQDETSVTVEEPVVLPASGEASAPVSDAESDGGLLLGHLDDFAGGNVRNRRMWFGKKGQGSASDGGQGSEDEAAINVIIDDQQGKEEDLRGRPMLATDGNHATRRSHSQVPSRPSSPTASSSVLSRSAPTSTPSSPPPPPPPTPGSNTGSAATFIQSLKFRGAVMAEKQPVLKEAMRKWGVGVNWAAGLRKNDKSNGREKGRDGDRDRDNWGMEDHNELWSGARSEGSRGRGSYADVRKKVEERDRDRRRLDESGTIPIDIPSRRLSKQTASSTSDSASPPTPSSPRKISPPTSGQLFPSAPRTTTELQIEMVRSPSPTPSRKELTNYTEVGHPPTKSTSPHRTLPAAISSDADASPTRTPIRAQPPKPAPMMTIPGIHASHRGEIMALGSQPAGLETHEFEKEKDGHGAGKPKTMHAVHRILRGGLDTGSEHGDKEANVSVTMPMTPPPLPPRSPLITPKPQGTLVSASPQTVLETGERSSDQTPLVDIEITPSTPPTIALSPASQALKSVVKQDVTALASLSPRAPPPLPFRRSTRQSAPSEASTVPFCASSEVQGVPSATTIVPPPSVATTMGHPIPTAEEKWIPPIPLPPRREHSQSQSSATD